MSEETDTTRTTLARERLEEVQTKTAYIVLAVGFVMNAAGVFSAEIPQIIFAGALAAMLGVDAAT